MQARPLNIQIVSLTAAVSLLFIDAAQADPKSSANFAIPRDTLNNGVGEMASANFRLHASLGETLAAGTITSVSFQLSSGFRGGVNAPAAVLNLLTVFSRKVHGVLPFSLTIADQPLSGDVTVEPRAIGGGHTIVFRFDQPITAEGAATALDSAMASAATVTLSRSGNDVIATLSNVADNKRLTLTLTGVNGSTNAQRSLAFLVGDVTSSRSVNAADIAAVRANLGRSVTTDSLAKFDLNADGTISSSDISAVKARSGQVVSP